LMEQIFGSLYFTIAYIVWFIALWFHLSHGFWSAFQTLGANNSIWIKRWQVVAQVYATVVVAGFIIIALNAYLKANGII
jgi:succinate dehydrogenase / fumarate reductase cytochrome b subunit